jgi:hypothetical protein
MTFYTLTKKEDKMELNVTLYACSRCGSKEFGIEIKEKTLFVAAGKVCKTEEAIVYCKLCGYVVGNLSTLP